MINCIVNIFIFNVWIKYHLRSWFGENHIYSDRHWIVMHIKIIIEGRQGNTQTCIQF